MSDAINLFPEKHLNDKVNQIYQEAAAKHRRLQIAFTDHHSRILMETLEAMADFQNTTNPLPHGGNLFG